MMGSVGLQPHEDSRPAVPVPPERLAQFDELISSGGIEAVIDQLKKEEAPHGRRFP